MRSQQLESYYRNRERILFRKRAKRQAGKPIKRLEYLISLALSEHFKRTSGDPDAWDDAEEERQKLKALTYDPDDALIQYFHSRTALRMPDSSAPEGRRASIG